MRSINEGFYKTPTWRKCRDEYIKSVGGLCERCLAKGIYKGGVIVHHKTHLSVDNYENPNISLNFENLELLCRDCHNAEHNARQRRYKVEWDGTITTK